MFGLAVAFSPSALTEAFADSKSRTTQEEDTMTQTSTTQPAREQAADQTAIRTYNFEPPRSELADLRSFTKAE